MNWAYSETTCSRCGIVLYNTTEVLNIDQHCIYCRLEIEDNIVWPWLITETCLKAITDCLNNRHIGGLPETPSVSYTDIVGDIMIGGVTK